MRRRTLAASALCLLLAACVHEQVVVLPPPGTAWIDPSSAVQLAAAAPRDGVTGVFAMTVRAVGRDERGVYLNSERDYRDQRNLTVVLTPDAAAELEGRLGGPLEQRLRGHAIQVSGTARRTKIVFFADGQATDKYYYQTHVRVMKAGQIRPV